VLALDLYNRITRIPYLIMLGIGVVFILQLFIGGLHDLSLSIDQTSDEKYRATIVLEHLLNHNPKDMKVANRRALIPLKMFTNEVTLGSDELGYVKNSNGCFIEGVPGLNGEDYIYKVEKLIENDNSGDFIDHDQIGCFESNVRDSVYSSALLVEERSGTTEEWKEDKWEVFIHVKPVED
jgi:hypothetical protein